MHDRVTENLGRFTAMNWPYRQVTSTVAFEAVRHFIKGTRTNWVRCLAKRMAGNGETGMRPRRLKRE
jgi:hypothetical protein